MCYRCLQTVLASLIIIFSIWKTPISTWTIIISAAIILIYQIKILTEEGCNNKWWIKHRMGSKLFMEKSEDELHEGPSRKEIKETLKKKK